MARSITTRSINPKIMDDNIKILDDALQGATTPDAEDVSYDNTDSNLTADDVQAAIDEVAPALTASGTSYDNTSSGLTADDVQGAINELRDLSDYEIPITLLNGWSGTLVATVNKYGKISAITGALILTENVTSGVFAGASTSPSDCITNNKIPVATQGGSIYAAVGSTDIVSFSQSGDDWVATLNSYDHNVVFNTIYGRA